MVDRKSDPLKLGRLKVRVYGIHDDEGAIPDDTLPWATVVTPATSASNQQVGIAPLGVTEGSIVFGFFMDGAECQIPMIMGTIPGIPDNDDSKHDVSKLAREMNISKVPLGTEPPSPYAAKYPYNKVTQTESGHIFEVDDTPGNERIHTYHKTGTYTEIDKNGTQVNKIVANNYLVVAGDDIVYIKGNCLVNIEGSAMVRVVGDLQADVTGNIRFKSRGETVIESEAKITLQAPMIDLNPVFADTIPPIGPPSPPPAVPPKHEYAGYTSPDLGRVPGGI